MLCLRQVKNYLNINTTQDDEYLLELFGYSLGVINNHCLREFDLEDRIDILRGNGRAYLSTPISPIQSITELKINGEIIPTTDYSIRNKMIFYPKYFPVKYLEVFENWQPNSYKRGYNVEVSYKAGYTFPLWTDVVNESNVPKELQYVCLEFMKMMYIDSGVNAQQQTKTISTTGESVAKQYFKANKFEIPNHLRLILDKYKRLGGAE